MRRLGKAQMGRQIGAAAIAGFVACRQLKSFSPFGRWRMFLFGITIERAIIYVTLYNSFRPGAIGVIVWSQFKTMNIVIVLSYHMPYSILDYPRDSSSFLWDASIRIGHVHKSNLF